MNKRGSMIQPRTDRTYYQHGSPSRYHGSKIRPPHFGRGWRKFRKHRFEK